MLSVVQLLALRDNYIYILVDPKTDHVACVDPTVADIVMDWVEKHHKKLTHILNTHHHWDHTGGNIALKEKYKCQIIGPLADQERIDGIDIALAENDIFSFGNYDFKVIDVPGHTKGHIAFWCGQENILFSGDTLFSLGCGRLFEGTPKQMWHSLQKIISLPGETKIYCGHEYTYDNARFALKVDPMNKGLQEKFSELETLKLEKRSSIPALLKDELKLNPFLKSSDPDFKAQLKMLDYSAEDVFAHLRKQKDSF